MISRRNRVVTSMQRGSAQKRRIAILPKRQYARFNYERSYNCTAWFETRRSRRMCSLKLLLSNAIDYWAFCVEPFLESTHKRPQTTTLFGKRYPEMWLTFGTHLSVSWEETDAYKAIPSGY